MLEAGVLHGMRAQDWVILLVTAACLLYLFAIAAGEAMAWWDKWRH